MQVQNDMMGCGDCMWCLSSMEKKIDIGVFLDKLYKHFSSSVSVLNQLLNAINSAFWISEISLLLLL